MSGQPAAALIERLRAVARVGQTVVGARDHVERARVGGPLEEPAAVGGRHHVVAVGLDQLTHEQRERFQTRQAIREAEQEVST